jgi:NAD(P)-dependent dehydrogenase (short-subunit alcohol dehydrogenase family)
MRRVEELMRCDGRVALVVGGGGHIGSTAAAVCAELGATVAIVDIDLARAQAVASSLHLGPGARAEGFDADIASESDARGVVDQVVKRFGRLDIFIHSAAFVGTTAYPGWGVPFSEQSASAFDAACRVNLTSAFVMAQQAAVSLAESCGAIVLVSSIYGSVGPQPAIYAGTNMQNPLGYGASKAGLQQLARGLATTLAPRVRVNTVSPGGVFRGQPESFVSRYEERTPLGRMASEEDLKGAFAYLVSDLSAYVTGHDLVVDGGWTAW